MDIRRLGFTAVLASLLIVLGIPLFFAPTSHGIEVKIGIKSQDCGDGSWPIVVHVLSPNESALYGETFRSSQIERRLREIFQRRTERIVFISASGELAFEDVLRVIDLVEGQADHVALLTPAAQSAPGTCLKLAVRPVLTPRGLPRPQLRMEMVPLWRFWP